MRPWEAEVKSNSGAGLLPRIRERAEITDDEGALRLDHLAFHTVGFTIHEVLKCQVLQAKKRCSFLKIEDLLVSKMF